jgi:hypothetical protein
MPLSVNVIVTLATQYHLEYHCKALSEAPCIRLLTVVCDLGFIIIIVNFYNFRWGNMTSLIT